jgi:anti-sigma regulatory factor (Ser/Thr protein kinase)
MSDQVTMRIPPTTPYVGLLRAMASGLGARLDFTYDQIMDLHIAIDEVCSRLLATTEGPTAIEVRFGLDTGQLSFEARAQGSGARSDREFLNPLSRMILEALVDSFDVAPENGSYVVRVEVRRGEQ